MDWSQVVPIAAQLPLVFIFIMYSDKLYKDARAERETLHSLHREERKEFLAELHKVSDSLEELVRELRASGKAR